MVQPRHAQGRGQCDRDAKTNDRCGPAVPDRRDAIARALEMGREGVVVVIAGKGHEAYQLVRDRTVPFDDRQVARDVLARLAGAGGKR